MLITGVSGFIGSHVCMHFKNKGYITYGIGRKESSIFQLENTRLDYLKVSDVSIASILEFNQKFDVIVHCGGSGSVGNSVEFPYNDFKKTVNGTLEVLEYIRLFNENAHLIYPSSPAVQGECHNEPIKESYIGKPASPYGFHKKIAENLCQSYAEKYYLNVSIIRLFSVYGIGLEKQILWDAYHKIDIANKEVTFFGTGNETRDFIHIDDVVNLFENILLKNNKFIIINGGTGLNKTIRYTVEAIKKLMKKDLVINFDNKLSVGNPIFYCADTTETDKYINKNKVVFEDGLKESIKWMKNNSA